MKLVSNFLKAKKELVEATGASLDDVSSLTIQVYQKDWVTRHDEMEVILEDGYKTVYAIEKIFAGELFTMVVIDWMVEGIEPRAIILLNCKRGENYV